MTTKGRALTLSMKEREARRGRLDAVRLSPAERIELEDKRLWPVLERRFQSFSALRLELIGHSQGGFRVGKSGLFT